MLLFDKEGSVLTIKPIMIFQVGLNFDYVAVDVANFTVQLNLDNMT